MANTTVKLGLNVAALALGFHQRRVQVKEVGFDAWIWRGLPGPVLLINAATHGDEYEGPTVLRQWVETWRPDSLHGAVIMIPVLNEAAFSAAQRCHPIDGGNLARAFPGKPRGKVTARLAHLFETQMLSQATHYVDLHSGGTTYSLMPWVGYLTRPGPASRTQKTMAACFDDYWCWAGPFLPGRTLSAAYARDIAAIYTESRGGGGVDPADLKSLYRGIENLLHGIGCLQGPTRPLRRQRTRTTRNAEEAHLQVHHPAPINGLFVPLVALAQRVRKGQVLGHVHNLSGINKVPIKAESTGRVVLIRRTRSVHRDTALFTLAPI